jgi:hypothetical protein
MESTDYQRYIANLRTIGCPEQTIRDIIIADVNKLFEERAEQIGSLQDFDYWKPGVAKGPNAHAERVQQHLALAQEQKGAEMASILSPEALEDYNMRYSRMAQGMRESFGAFEPAEHEFRESSGSKSGLKISMARPTAT